MRSCDRHTGVGADGLIAVAPVNGAIAMTLFNADGSRAEISGNGARCVAGAVHRATGAVGPIQLLTDAGPRAVTLRLNGMAGDGEVDMGTVQILRPIAGTLGVASVGNPHAVVQDEATWSTAEREGRARELAQELGGANVEFVTINSRSDVSIVVVERGVGWTLACGTGSVATAAVLHSLDLVDSVVRVANPGGVLTVTLTERGAVLAGPVAFVADVTWNAP
jgi:diaminopimelate epimerase